jgi:4-amino-4-deoxy-L-arabinose transferase
VAHALAKPDPDALWITKQSNWPKVRTRFAALGQRTVVQGTPYQGRVLFRVVPGNGG